MKSKKCSIEEFLKLKKTLNIVPKDFEVDRLRELPAILERAREHAKRLAFAKIVPCDVCLENFVKEKQKRLELASRIANESLYLSAKEMTAELLEKLYPEFDAEASRENGRVRVHGMTNNGKYQTYCHFCDADMCLSEVNEGPDWDTIYESQYRKFLPQLPELLNVFLLPMNKWEEIAEFWENSEVLPGEIEAIIPEVRGFYFFGSTSWFINVDLLVDSGQLNWEVISFAHEGRKWNVRFTPANDPIVKKIREIYKPL